MWKLGKWTWTYFRYVYYSFRRRFLCPIGRHGDHWAYFGSRSRICRVCHREEWFYPHSHPQWQAPPRNTSAFPVSGHDEPTDGN